MTLKSSEFVFPMAAIKPHATASIFCTIIIFTMTTSLLPQFFFISVLSTIIFITNFTHADSQCLEDQKSLLLELKNELIFNSSYSRKLVQWNQTMDCCTWAGVECDAVGHVISLKLNFESISGGIENSSIFNLRYLKKLNFAHNNFNYTQIPREIGNLTNLTHLNLSDAGFGGEVPIELSRLRSLVSLDISSFYLFIYRDLEVFYTLNNIPLKLGYSNLKMLLQNLTGLRELYLDNFDISAQESEWYHLIYSSLPDLRNLSLRHCGLSGPLDPFLSQFHSLTILRLNGNNLSAVVPNFFANFSSLTVLSLRNCSLKGSLDLPNNLFTGSHYSMHFRGLFNLVYLNLADNSLSGNIPLSLFGIPSLQVLVLSGNQFSGQLNEFPTLNLSLVSLFLEDNSLNGSIPQSLFALPSLEILWLSNNQFSGQVNEFPTPNRSNMDGLDLSGNRLEGQIPESFFQLESLESLDLSYNFFNGTFELEKIRRLRYLFQLVLSYNNLSVEVSSTNSSFSAFPQLKTLMLASCNLHSFPDLKKQSYLTYLDLSNNRITGEIPSWIWEIGNGGLQVLNLSGNLLVGLQKPHKIPNSDFRILDLNSNQLQDEVSLFFLPTTLGITSSLSFFSLANNSLIGSIPTSLCNASSLRVIDLSVNKLNGDMPPCLIENTDILEVLNLRRNNISGDIPDKFSVNCALKTLDLSNNNLAGNIPISLANCKLLELMNVGNNRLNGSFPCMLSSSLHVLVLRSNRFHGEVRCLKSWPKLQIIDVASNNLSGNLYPISFSSWRGMMLESDAQTRHNHSASNFLQLSTGTAIHYRDEVTLTVKGVEVKLVKIWADFTSVDFSCNNFHGAVPDAIGNLSSLNNLNLSHNALTGRIPKSFGNLSWLESLDLSGNQLSGMIPMELARLNFLSVLNLSYNKLVGMIPDGPQFRTFSADSFQGNMGLCGFPLNTSCNNANGNDSFPPKHESVQSHGKMEIEWEYVSAALGYVVGLGSIIWLLLCCRSLREKYFEKVDEVLDKIFGRQDRKRRQRRRALRNQVRRQ